MKTLKIFLICLISIFSIEFAKSQIVVRDDESLFFYNGKTADTLGTDSAMYKIISIKEPGYYNYNIDVDVDSAGDGSAVTVYLQAKMHSYDDWETLTTVSWTGAVDTVITFSNLVAYTETYGDSIASNALTTTVAQGGIIWPEIRIFFQGLSSASDISLDDIVGIINRRKNY